MYKGKPCQPVMSLREEQQMNVDTESAAHTGMECHSRSSHKYLLLQVWCGLLTVAMVVMAALLSSVKPKSSEDEVSAVKPAVPPTGNSLGAQLKSPGSLSYIQLIKSPDNRCWQDSNSCKSCSLILRNDSIHCLNDSLYFMYAQVTYSKVPTKDPTKSVVLMRNFKPNKSVERLVEGTFPNTTVGSVWVANIVKLKKGDIVSIDITGEFRTDSTFWGAYELH